MTVTALAAIFGALQAHTYLVCCLEAFGHAANNGSVFGKREAPLVVLRS